MASVIGYRATKQAQAVARDLRPVPKQRHDRIVAEELLMAALCNYHRAATSPVEVSLKAANELTEAERAVFGRAVARVMTVLWSGQ